MVIRLFSQISPSLAPALKPLILSQLWKKLLSTVGLAPLPTLSFIWFHDTRAQGSNPEPLLFSIYLLRAVTHVLESSSHSGSESEILVPRHDPAPETQTYLSVKYTVTIRTYKEFIVQQKVRTHFYINAAYSSQSPSPFPRHWFLAFFQFP